MNRTAVRTTRKVSNSYRALLPAWASFPRKRESTATSARRLNRDAINRIAHHRHVLEFRYRNFESSFSVTLVVTIRRRSPGMVMSDEFPEERRWTVMGLGSQAGRSGFRNPDALGADQREGGTVVQTGGVVQGANTIPRRGWLNVLLAVAAVVAIAVVALLIWVVPPVTSGVGVEEAVPAARAGSAIVHDDAGSVHTGWRQGMPPSMTTPATCPRWLAQPSFTTTRAACTAERAPPLWRTADTLKPSP